MKFLLALASPASHVEVAITLDVFIDTILSNEYERGRSLA